MGIQADALFSKTQQRVLALLFGQPEKAFYLKEIIDWANSGTGTVQRELSKLEQADLLRSWKVGHQRFYQANEVSPIFFELCGIVNKTFGLVGGLQDALSPLHAQIRLAFVYGSMAKGSERADSDIDLLVVGDLSHQALLEQLRDAQTYLGRTINPTLYTEAEFRSRIEAGKSFITRVLDQPKLFVIGSEKDLNDFRTTY